MSAVTWGVFHAMERSHSWSSTRGIMNIEYPRRCSVCGDGETDACRYCPGPQPAEKKAEAAPVRRAAS